MSGQTRSLLTEFVGTGLCSLPLLTIALAAGWTWTPAISLGLINLARAWPTLLFVRTVLRSSRGENGFKSIAVASQFFAPGLLTLLALSQLVPWSVVAINSVLSARALFFLSGIVPLSSARRIGISEVFWRIGYVVFVAIAYHGNAH